MCLTSLPAMEASKSFLMISIASNMRGRALAGLGPVAADDVLVQGLARADAEPGAAGVHRLERRRRLGDDRRVEPERRAGHAGAEVAGGALADSGQHVPHEGGLALLRHPGLEVVGGHAAGEAVLLGQRGQLDRLGGVELLQHGGVADGEIAHGTTLVPAGGSLAGRRRAQGFRPRL